MNGDVDLIVEGHGNNKEHLLDVLQPGGIIGQYSVINESPFQFSAKARTNVSLLVLKRDDLLFLAEISDHLSDAIEVATNYIIENEAPFIDYSVEHAHQLTKSGKLAFFEG